MQGALDGGLDIPHNEKRLVGYDRSGKKMDAEVLKKYIFGGHVAEYMEEMEEEEPEKYMKHFSKFLENDLSGGDLEDKYAEVNGARTRGCRAGWRFFGGGSEGCGGAQNRVRGRPQLRAAVTGCGECRSLCCRCWRPCRCGLIPDLCRLRA